MPTRKAPDVFDYQVHSCRSFERERLTPGEGRLYRDGISWEPRPIRGGMLLGPDDKLPCRSEARIKAWQVSK